MITWKEYFQKIIRHNQGVYIIFQNRWLKPKIIKNPSKFIYIFLLLLLSLFACFGWIGSSFPKTHEFFAPIYILMDFDKAFTDGNLLVNWLPNFAGGGEPVFNFYPPVAYYISEFIHLAGFSYAGAIKIAVIMSYFFSGITMFVLMKKITSNNIAALISASAYMIFPYHLVDSHLRGDIAETFSFIFLPLVFYYLYDIFKKDNFAQVAICAGISYAILILTHILISYLLFFFLLSYFIYTLVINSNQFKRIFYSYTIFGISALVLSAFYWLPALLERNYINSALVEVNPAEHYIFISQLLLPSAWAAGGSGAGFNNTMPLSIGFFAELILILSLYLLVRDHTRGGVDENQFIFLFFALISIFLTTNYGLLVFELIPLSNFIQFPWRALAISALFISMIAGYVTKGLSGQSRRFVGLILFLFLVVSSYQTIYIPDGYISLKNPTRVGDFFRSEYLPVYKEKVFGPLPEGYPEIIYEGHYEFLEKLSTYWKFKTDSDSSLSCKVKIFYFPRWTCYIDGAKIGPNISREGTIALDIPGGSHIIEIKYEDTSVSLISKILSLLGLIGAIIALSLDRVMQILILILGLIVISTAGGATEFSRVILASDVLAKINAVQPAEFDNCTIVGDLNLNALDIEEQLHFNHTLFQDLVSFNFSSFEGTAYFIGSNFKKTAYFISSKFNSYAYFADSNFEGPAYFIDSSFRDIANFNHSNFNNPAYFIASRFTGAAEFNNSNFNDNTYFIDSEFKDTAGFGYSNFNGAADLGYSNYEGAADFSYSNFKDISAFGYSNFNGATDFSHSNFNRIPYPGFSCSNFNSQVYFIGSSFNDTALFIGSNFKSTVDFSHSNFRNSAYFSGSNLNLPALPE